MTNPKKAVFIIAQNNFRDEELKIPQEILEKNGIKVVLAAASLKSARGTLGAIVHPEKILSEVNVSDYDAVVFIGGSGSAQYWNDETAHKIAGEAFRQNKVLAAICIAPVTLANAGVLKGKRCTVWPSESAVLAAKGGLATAANLEIDGNLITASGPEAAQEFGEAILEKLK